MVRTTRLTVGSIVRLPLAVGAEAAMAAGPALAQETTADGMGGNETMADGTVTMEDGTGDDETTTDETVGAGDGTSTDDEMGTESMGDESTTEEDTMDEEVEAEMDEGTASGGQPGFGVLLALTALVAAAALLSYRRRG